MERSEDKGTLKQLIGKRDSLIRTVEAKTEHGKRSWVYSAAYADGRLLTTTTYTEADPPANAEPVPTKWQDEITKGSSVFDTRLGEGSLTVSYDWNGKVPSVEALKGILAEQRGARTGPGPIVAFGALAAGRLSRGFGAVMLRRRALARRAAAEKRE
jgi:hypothetical protein